MRFKLNFLAVLALAFSLAGPALAAKDSPTLHLILKDHKFVPRQITIPAGKKVKISIKNENGQTAEFRSFDMHAQTTIADGEEASVFVGPLKAGSYSYFDSLDVNRAAGKIIVR